MSIEAVAIVHMLVDEKMNETTNRSEEKEAQEKVQGNFCAYHKKLVC